MKQNVTGKETLRVVLKNVITTVRESNGTRNENGLYRTGYVQKITYRILLNEKSALRRLEIRLVTIEVIVIIIVIIEITCSWNFSD